ncbi:short-chain dehydrogenase [Ferruginibacter albus]|uniref:short-chain dehydrogenase n=1 Tax=Ferruginibacter albus TaxID=2875540 RepID=UPI001CC6985A|nr:short-chain dehydrogenase [Ferruginibacter albus]UAY51334.1 short-chain dehydrogenase [Ferruginibacter albus]
MTSEQIENFLSKHLLDNTEIRINFKSRNAVKGIFIQTNDFNELKSKNFWRIVGEQHIPEFKKTKDINLAKIFNGTEFTKLGLT